MKDSCPLVEREEERAGQTDLSPGHQKATLRPFRASTPAQASLLAFITRNPRLPTRVTGEVFPCRFVHRNEGGTTVWRTVVLCRPTYPPTILPSFLQLFTHFLNLSFWSLVLHLLFFIIFLCFLFHFLFSP